MANVSMTNDTMEQRFKNVANTAADRAADMAETASDKIGAAVNSAEETARDVAAQSREAGEHVKKVAGNIGTAIQKSAKDEPMATLAVAAGIGFVIGALWKS